MTPTCQRHLWTTIRRERDGLPVCEVCLRCWAIRDGMEPTCPCLEVDGLPQAVRERVERGERT